MRRFLPKLNSWQYFAMLVLVAVFLLGSLGAIMGAFMLFSIGFSVGVQVFAGIIGSIVTLPYGPEGKHGGNYMQTAAASVASIGSLCVLLQARAWLSLPEFDNLTLMAYVGSIGMFGIGVGMLYTPIVVDRMQLPFPSGHAVANILKALTDPKLLRMSVTKLGSGAIIGGVLGYGINAKGWLGSLGLSVSTVGAGLLVGARIAVPGFIAAYLGELMLPWLRSSGYVGPEDPYRKILFVVALGMILGASVIDISKIMYEAITKYRGQAVESAPDWQATNKLRLLLWVLGWGAAVLYIGMQWLHLPLTMLLLALGLSVVFLLINGISVGISDSNPVSSAFVIGVFLMGALGLQDIRVGLLCASVLLVACSVGVDMQQDRSTGWRLGTNRMIQFRYQMVGIILGSVLCVVLGQFFLNAFPVLQLNQFGVEKTEEMARWNSAFAYKLVGVLKGLTSPNPHFLPALELGIAIGFVIELLRRLIKRNKGYQAFVKSSRIGFGIDFILNTTILPSPYAFSFGWFVDLMTALWFAVGGTLSSVYNHFFVKQAEGEAIGKEEMSGTSLVGGGLIAGESLAIMVIGVLALAKTLL